MGQNKQLTKNMKNLWNKDYYIIQIKKPQKMHHCIRLIKKTLITI